MGKIFTGLMISHTNDFPSNQNDKIQGWIEHNGGTYSKDITPDVTHLITSLKSWKRLPGSLREIRRQRHVKIVKLDWLLDCLKTAKPKRLKESNYYYEKFKPKPLKRTKRKAETADTLDEASKKIKTSIPHDNKVLRAGLEFDKACQKMEKEMAGAGFHPYQDKSGLVHMVNLVRKDVLRNLLDKHKLQVGPPAIFLPLAIIPGRVVYAYYIQDATPFFERPAIACRLPSKITRRSRVSIRNPWAESLQLYESDAQPHSYACITQYTQHRRKEVTTEELAPAGSTFDFAWTLFRRFFEKRCGPWNGVLTKSVREVDLDGLSGDDRAWTYQLHNSFTPIALSNHRSAESLNDDDYDNEIDVGTSVSHQPADKAC